MDATARGAPGSGKVVRSGREIIDIEIGKAGCLIGHEFWKDLCEEHRVEHSIRSQLGHYFGDEDVYSDYLDVFFNEGSRRWVPRSILLDLNMHDLAYATNDSLGELFRPENIVGSDEGSGNCYAKAFHTEGPDLAERCLELVRKEVERCNCLQGIQCTHSICGGTGSGLTGLLLSTLHDYLDNGSKCILQNFTLCPSPTAADIVLEPYNAALALQDLLDHSQQAFLFDNHALSDLCHKAFDLDSPKMSKLNNLVAMVMSGITASLRFTGPLNASLAKMHTNLVPFNHSHFLITGLAPVCNLHRKKYSAPNVIDFAQQMISKDNLTVTCDPVSVGDTHCEPPVPPSRYLAAWATWRGRFTTYEVDEVMRTLQKPESRYEKFFPDWIPCTIASNIITQPHTDVGDSVTFTSNSTSVSKVFERCLRNWDKMFKSKSHVHTFEAEGVSMDQMKESRTVLEYIIEQYAEFARWDDKLVDPPGTMGRSTDFSGRNDEEQRICKELVELGDGEMWITEVDARQPPRRRT